MSTKTPAKSREAGHEDADDFINSIDPKDMRDGARLRRIAAAAAAIRADEAELQAAVDSARAAGDSWTMIGLVLGFSKQNAQRKFGR